MEAIVIYFYEWWYVTLGVMCMQISKYELFTYCSSFPSTLSYNNQIVK